MTTDLAAQNERPERSKGAEHGPALVSGNRLATHFGISRQHVERLTAEGVIERRADGLFDQDQARLKYLTHLRSENRRSPRTKADAEHTAAKAELLQIKIAEKKKVLMLASEHWTCPGLVEG
jgi:hypothetical protein